MTVLRMHGVGVCWLASVPVLENVSMVLDRGMYGLVGANGAGKTTLLAIASGVLAPHEGSVSLQPRDAVIAYCPQRVDGLDADVEAFALREDGLAAELRGRLGLEPPELKRWSTLSSGERKRWQVGAALAQEPDVLLLDEPTNHLDVDARKSLLRALRKYAGLGIIVSHDRSVLDSLTQATLRIHDRTVALYTGCYSEARNVWQRERAEQEEAHASARARVHRAEAQLDAARRTQASAERGISARTRMKNKNDSDARGMLATTLAKWAENRAGRVVGVARGEVLRARLAVPKIERDTTLGRTVFATYELAPNAVLFHLDKDEIRAGQHTVLRDVRLTIGREERLRIEGANGAGKTTLLKALLASFGRSERILYLLQELDAALVSQLYERLAATDAETRGRILSVFAAFGSEPERILHGDRTKASPGEARKLLLAEALGRQAWALILDEPTNHLDLPSVERLEQALVAYPGCVVMVTHDDAFAAKVTTRTLRVAEGTVL